MRPSEHTSGAVWRLLSEWVEVERQRDRLHRKITQGDMAKMFGVSTQTISTWKLCQARMPTPAQLRVIAATGISREALAAAIAEDEPRIAEHVESRRLADLDLEDQILKLVDEYLGTADGSPREALRALQADRLAERRDLTPALYAAASDRLERLVTAERASERANVRQLRKATHAPRGLRADAAREVGGKGKAQKAREKQDQVGQESQDPGGMNPA